jgi:hypothetical protein
MTRTGLIALLGATMLCAAPAYAAELVTNGDFEANTSNLDGTSTIPGWTVTGDGIANDQVFPNSGVNDVVFTADGPDPFSGAPGDPDPGVLSQDLATVAGASYQLSFELLNVSGSANDVFTVSFGGFSMSFSGLDAPFFYTPETFAIGGSNITGALTTLSFQGVTDPVFGANWNLDDVSVTDAATGVVPEPSAWALMLSGFFGIGWALRRRTLAATAPG